MVSCIYSLVLACIGMHLAGCIWPGRQAGQAAACVAAGSPLCGLSMPERKDHMPMGRRSEEIQAGEGE